ncbi:Parapinopsin [Exaiptasia diaphana]|nr:Parapinopsin [Exaiptasia diaphana]
MTGEKQKDKRLEMARRSLELNSMLKGQTALHVRRRKSQVKVVRMIAASVLAFVLSWSPYCVVCLIAMIKHEYIISSGEAEIPELMAKASVIYNPFVYIAMNREFRKTVKKIGLCDALCQSYIISCGDVMVTVRSPSTRWRMKSACVEMNSSTLRCVYMMMQAICCEVMREILDHRTP